MEKYSVRIKLEIELMSVLAESEDAVEEKVEQILEAMFTSHKELQDSRTLEEKIEIEKYEE